ncbi:hypothetical protein [Zhongshania marina]|jgi:hypothetical protein|uniref:Uncharacterized protein n=1 Tax=Zhongshania marina TaxID=2304603 RepID=A0ABX9W019_9GAMM|nr:hypothetical protein D0911_13380 [Zhongshania marina]
MLAWLFALIGMLATGVNLQAAALDTDRNFNKHDSSQIFVFSSGSNAMLVSERDDYDHSFSTSKASVFTGSQPSWRFIGLVSPTANWAPALQALVHLRPPLRAPPFN